MSARVESKFRMTDPAAGKAILDVRNAPCLICDKPSAKLDLWSPRDNECLAMGVPPGKTAFLVYSLCHRCHKRRPRLQGIIHQKMLRMAREALDFSPTLN